MTEPRRRARRIYPRSIGFQQAYVDGWHARLRGVPADENPYGTGARRHRTRSGWRPVWRAVWLRGWLDAGV